jgi:GNAT superfamily N-acetyltransferase
VSGGPVMIRPAVPADAALIHRFISELAAYEREPDAVRATPELLTEALFGDDPAAECLIAELDGAPAGFALFYRTFSTWEGRPGIWLEDLYVAPEIRRGGVGGALLRELAALTIARGYTRLEWNALDWNAPALGFYAAIGADRLSEWELHRITGDALAAVAAGQVAAAGHAPASDGQ